MIALRLLDEVSWLGAPVPGGRTHALLAALVAAGGRVVPETSLVEEVWGDGDPPANPGKALQVVVSRLRAQVAAEVVTRTDHGYRLGLPADDVDVLVLQEEAAAAAAAERRGDLVAARDHARVALALPVPSGAAEGPLGELREAGARGTREELGALLGRALSALGDHGEALPLLETTQEDGESTTAALLRSLAAVHGAPTALERYELHRGDLADRLGVDPGPLLQAVHGELLAADNPVRSGVRFESTSLVGRDEDIRALRALVRESRVVSILGPGGLGKTRLAHLLGQEAEQSVVHFVELVGVSSPEDVVGEVGSALGVRDSVSGRRSLTIEQRHDVRARIAQRLDVAPSLLILDNCEHVIEAVADLVAYLVPSARQLRVVTTTRAPLAIAAERVFPLGQLDEDAGADLFCQRARAARPGVVLDVRPEGAVRRVVRRLDGLPLAIELAAAKTRVMSVEDIDRRLDDRFALLRGGDRSAPDRHQTLLAVIDWSWNLLTEGQRRALRWLSVFHDGFSLTAAGELLGHDGLDDVQALVDQSLLTVLDAPSGVRYRMLETVREFGRMQLVGAGEDDQARAARAAWACRLAQRAVEELWGEDQVAAVHALLPEENNLADCLRAAVAVPDPATVATLTAALGSFWTVRGENIRVIALTGAVDAALADWEPQPDEVDVAVTAAAMMVMNSVVGEITDADACEALLDRYGEVATDPRARGLVRVLRVQDMSDHEGTVARLAAIAEEDDPATAALARLWAAHHLENAGDPERALEQAAAGLAAADRAAGPWTSAMMQTLMAGLNAQLGRHEEAARHARLALPVLDLLDAEDDAIQVRSLLAMNAIVLGRHSEAEELIAQVEGRNGRRTGLGGAFVVTTARAELALAQGRVADGLVLYRVAVEELRELSFPGLGDRTGLEPWTVVGEASALTAFALLGAGSEGEDLFDTLVAKAAALLETDRPHLDYPVVGMAMHGLGAWGLLRGALDAEVAVRLLVLARQFAYPRYIPTMSPDRVDEPAERLAPGVAAAYAAELGPRRGRDLLPAARAVLQGVLAPR